MKRLISFIFVDFSETFFAGAALYGWDIKPLRYYYCPEPRVPECKRIRKGWLDQYGAEHFEV